MTSARGYGGSKTNPPQQGFMQVARAQRVHVVAAWLDWLPESAISRRMGARSDNVGLR